MPIITLTTDFGLKDPFVGIMKGVILSICPQATVIDLTHNITPQDIKETTFVLASAYRFFPKGTIHIIVVDPGVGSQRLPLLVKTPNYFFIAPDNGVLELIYQKEKVKVYHLNRPEYFLPQVSATFHGRDIFAPVAAHLAKGVLPEALGEEIEDFIRLNWPWPEISGQMLKGEVIYIDRFGNLITNISKEDFKKFIKPFSQQPFRIHIKDITLDHISPYYLAERPGTILALWDSSDHLEIACCLGNAKERLGVGVGEGVVVEVLK